MYTLKIISLSAGGIESAERDIIEINPPFWSSWGFYGLLILIIIGILYLIDRGAHEAHPQYSTNTIRNRF